MQILETMSYQFKYLNRFFYFLNGSQRALSSTKNCYTFTKTLKHRNKLKRILIIFGKKLGSKPLKNKFLKTTLIKFIFL